MDALAFSDMLTMGVFITRHRQTLASCGSRGGRMVHLALKIFNTYLQVALIIKQDDSRSRGGGWMGEGLSPPHCLVSHFAPPRHLWTSIGTNCFFVSLYFYHYALWDSYILCTGNYHVDQLTSLKDMKSLRWPRLPGAWSRTKDDHRVTNCHYQSARKGICIFTPKS